MKSSSELRGYVPEAGDLIWTDFDARVGREQSGRRPALVVSPADFCRVTEFAIVCPSTSRVRIFGTSVVLPLGLPVSGEVLTSHVRSIATLARPISYAGAGSRGDPQRRSQQARCFARPFVPSNLARSSR